MATKSEVMRNLSLNAGDRCYAFVGDTCLSGTIESIQGEAATVRLVTGHVVSRLLSELRVDSPRLDDGAEWPV